MLKVLVCICTLRGAAAECRKMVVFVRCGYLRKLVCMSSPLLLLSSNFVPPNTRAAHGAHAEDKSFCSSFWPSVRQSLAAAESEENGSSRSRSCRCHSVRRLPSFLFKPASFVYANNSTNSPLLDGRTLSKQGGGMGRGDTTNFKIV